MLELSLPRRSAQLEQENHRLPGVELWRLAQSPPPGRCSLWGARYAPLLLLLLLRPLPGAGSPEPRGRGVHAAASHAQVRSKAAGAVGWSEPRGLRGPVVRLPSARFWLQT